MTNKKIHLGNLTITRENQGQFDDIEEATGSVSVNEGVTFTAPLLMTRKKVLL